MSDVTHPESLTRRGVPIDPSLRTLALATFVNRMGGGALTTTFALYFTQVVGLTATHVGIALSVAALVGMIGQVPLGQLGDDRGPREVLRVLTAIAGVATLGLLVTRDPIVLTAVLAAQYFFDRGSGAVRNGIIARLGEGRLAVRFKAYLRAVTNVAVAVGALLGGVALVIGQPWAYLAVFGLNAVTYLGAAWVLGRLPHLEPAPPRTQGESRLPVLRDRPFVVVCLLNGIYAIHFMVMELGIPLWVAERTAAPNWVVAAVLLLNTVAVAAFQVRLSRGSDDVMSSARRMVAGSAWIAAGFLVMAFADGVGVVGAIVLMLAGAAIHVVGEMVGSGGQWGVQMGLAPRERQGQYQGFVGTTWSLAVAISPPLVTLLCIDWGRPGWFVLAALIVGAALATVPVSRWALDTRARYGVTTHNG